jgi:hypothetical protein
MISGYPHDRGLFVVACEVIEKDLSVPVQSVIVGLGGFPALVLKNISPGVFWD